MRRMHLLLAGTFALAGCATAVPNESAVPTASTLLIVLAGDEDEKDDDFLAIVDVDPASSTVGKVVSTQTLGMKASMPHHMEYVLPPRGEPLFMNLHHHEHTLLVDTSDVRAPKVVKSLPPPRPFRFTHDYWRLPNGNRLLGFLRSEGPSPKPGDDDIPGNHGGIAEYDVRGNLLRTASAAVPNYPEPIRPYAFAPMLAQDRILTTGASMMEDESADVVQIWRYSDFKLLHTLKVPPALRADGSPEPLAARTPFVPRVMADGSVLFNTYSCGLYRVTGITSSTPQLTPVHLIDAPPPPKPDASRGACGIPVVENRWWVMPVGRAHRIVTFDISNPAAPREVARLDTPEDFNPHWAAKDPHSDRIVVGAELGGEKGMFIVRLDPATGALRFDDRIRSAGGRAGYIDLGLKSWPHGETGPAWAHAALFLPRP